MEKGLSGLEGLLATVGLTVTAKVVRTGTSSEKWRERVADSRNCSAETVGTK